MRFRCAATSLILVLGRYLAGIFISNCQSEFLRCYIFMICCINKVNMRYMYYEAKSKLLYDSYSLLSPDYHRLEGLTVIFRRLLPNMKFSILILMVVLYCVFIWEIICSKLVPLCHLKCFLSGYYFLSSLFFFFFGTVCDLSFIFPILLCMLLLRGLLLGLWF